MPSFSLCRLVPNQISETAFWCSRKRVVLWFARQGEGHNGLLSSKIVFPHPEEFGEEFYGNSSRMGLLI